MAARKLLTIAIAGNPNCGKTDGRKEGRLL